MRLTDHALGQQSLDSAAAKQLFALAVLNVFLKIAIVRLEVADVFLSLPFFFQVLITDYLAGDFLDFTFRFFDSALDLISVHDGLLLMNVDDQSERHT
jgi:hypothetical protein